jgi:hypothetical protein
VLTPRRSFRRLGTVAVPSPTTRASRAAALRGLACLALVGLLVAATPGHAQQDAASEATETEAAGTEAAGTEAAGLRRLAERIVGTWGPPGHMRVAFHVAALPDDLAVPLPIPAAFDVVGSLVRYELDTLVSLQVVLDGPPHTSEAFEALRSAFEADGWTVFSDAEQVEVGFVPTIPTLFARACAPADGEDARPVAFLNASPGAEGRSDVRVDLTSEGWLGACAPAHRPERDRYAPLPTLAAPEGGEVSGSLVSVDVEDATAHAVLRGAVEVEAIVEHYEAELEAAGWSRLPGGASDDFGTRSPWSLVSDAGRLWVGLLTVDRPTRTGPAMLSFALVAEPGP